LDAKLSLISATVLKLSIITFSYILTAGIRPTLYCF